ncbi:MAG: carboxymuconolactone decarboxylase family protein [Alsobacter sp.]
MNAITFPSIETASAECLSLVEGPRQHLGFVPNLLLGLGEAPAVLAAYIDLSRHFAKVGLSGVETQVVLLVASIENACGYCIAAHSTFATNMKIDPAALAALRQCVETPDEKLNALANYVRMLIRTKGNVPRRDLERFVAAGYTRQQALGVLVGVAMKTIANLGNHVMQTPLDAQFAAQGWAE